MKVYVHLFISLLFIPVAFSQDAAITPIPGFVDMHTHPRNDLAFGTQLFYGAPYGDMAEAMGNCKDEHSKGMIRSILVAQTEQQYNSDWKSGKDGYPDFETWPSWCSILHQQMSVEWIERAHLGGLNIMVALAVSSHIMAFAGKTDGPRDDGQVLLNCIQGIRDMVAHSTFMEIALSPEDVRRIVADGKLAVIIGTEMDNIGNFYSPADNYEAAFNPDPSNEEIKAELDKLWDLGVRYIFPVHLNNTVFGGSALAMSPLNVANKFATGEEFIPEEVNTEESGISFSLEHPIVGMNAIAKMFLPLLLPKSVNPGKKGNYTHWEVQPGFGHRNSLGITDKGNFAINYMMQKGFLIDIDHMSEKMADVVLNMAVAHGYPVNSGHNGLRGEEGNENDRTAGQYKQIRDVGGMIGLGHSETAENFVNQYRRVMEIVGHQGIGIGTDVNGFLALPRPDEKIKVEYDDNFTRCTTGNRTWDIHIDGVAHYGLLPDYIKSWESAGMTPEEKSVFVSSAEHFTVMWEKCESRKAALAQ